MRCRVRARTRIEPGLPVVKDLPAAVEAAMEAAMGAATGAAERCWACCRRPQTPSVGQCS